MITKDKSIVKATLEYDDGEVSVVDKALIVPITPELLATAKSNKISLTLLPIGTVCGEELLTVMSSISLALDYITGGDKNVD